MSQKTMTELLGPIKVETDEVAGRFIVRSEGDNRYKVLWSFENAAHARAAFEFWKRGE